MKSVDPVGWLDKVQFAKTSKIVFVVVLIASMLAVLTVWQDPQVVAQPYVSTSSGPVGPADRDLLYKVKQAGLWEMPVGNELAHSPNPDVAAIGAKMALEHMQLNAMTDKVAQQLGVELPDSPTPDQQSWMTKISEIPPGTLHDRTAVFYLRRAHGIVLPLLANVKSGTRNDLIRQFATEGMVYVNRHMTYLESTGMVDYSQLPEPPTPNPYQAPSVASYWDSHDLRTMAVGAIVILVLGVLLAAIVIPMAKAQPKKVKPVGGKRRRIA